MPHGPRIALGCSSASIASCASLRRLTAFVRSSNHPSNRYRDRVWRNHARGERAARIKTSSAPPRAFQGNEGSRCSLTANSRRMEALMRNIDRKDRLIRRSQHCYGLNAKPVALCKQHSRMTASTSRHCALSCPIRCQSSPKRTSYLPRISPDQDNSLHSISTATN